MENDQLWKDMSALNPRHVVCGKANVLLVLTQDGKLYTSVLSPPNLVLQSSFTESNERIVEVAMNPYGEHCLVLTNVGKFFPLKLTLLLT